MFNTIFGGVAAFLAGGALATVTVVGVVSSQTAAPERSPANSQQAFVDYGSTE